MKFWPPLVNRGKNRSGESDIGFSQKMDQEKSFYQKKQAWMTVRFSETKKISASVIVCIEK